MSQITNVINTVFRAVGGNVVSEMNSYAAGFGRLGSQIGQNVDMSARLNNQWKAFGTTLRYAVAGASLYGLGNMLRTVSQINQQLGTMQALSEIGPAGGIRYSNNDMQQLFEGLQQAAVDT